MEKVGIILGRNIGELKFFKKAIPKVILTPYGKSKFFFFENLIFLFRHQKETPPHKINHKANIFGFKKLKTKLIFGFNSVGSLKKEIKPGTLLIPSDFIDFDPPTFFNTQCKFITPEISQKAREILKKVLKDLKINFREKGVYFQTKGPRLETKAEIRMIKNFADVVGMTMAKEATLAQELNLNYASLCFVDNCAHGITKKSLTQKEIEKNQKKNIKIIEKIIQKFVYLFCH